MAWSIVTVKTLSLLDLLIEASSVDGENIDDEYIRDEMNMFILAVCMQLINYNNKNK